MTAGTTVSSIVVATSSGQVQLLTGGDTPDRPPVSSGDAVPDLPRMAMSAERAADTPPSQRRDQRWMRRALALAEVARGHTGPNPFVGAVVVAPDGAEGMEVGVGSTGPVGTAHAEPRALQAAGARARDATLYVTLEPCAHHGRTAPCTDAVVAAGIGRVVIGMRDPNPVAAGGVDVLRSAGIEVETGVLSDRVAAQLEVFTTAVVDGRAHVTCKLAQTTDGITDPAVLSRRWITGQVARDRVHDLRAGVAGIMVGSTTALVDDPDLTVRAAAPGPVVPRAVVVDRRGRLPLGHRVVRPGTIVLTRPTAPAGWQQDLASRGVEVVAVASLTAGLAALVARDVVSVLAEPGPVLAGALLAAGVVDRLLVHVADSSVTDPGRIEWAVPVTGMEPVARRRLGPDVEWEFHPAPAVTPWSPRRRPVRDVTSRDPAVPRGASTAVPDQPPTA